MRRRSDLIVFQLYQNMRLLHPRLKSGIRNDKTYFVNTLRARHAPFKNDSNEIHCLDTCLISCLIWGSSASIDSIHSPVVSAART
jgi:hypothetical protein